MIVSSPGPALPCPAWPAAVAALAGRRLVVIGDVMLDDYLAGDARRICPEAPVPVVETTRRWAVPGGAANAAVNAIPLGGRAVLGGLTGDDPAGAELARAVRAAGVDPAGLVSDPARPTTTKLRILARGQQVLRVDTESTGSLGPAATDLLAGWAERAIAGADAVLLSDYLKGAVTPGLARRVIEAARRAGRPVVVDPKGVDAARYYGASVLKPNLNELADMTGRAVATTAGRVDAGRQLADELAGTAVLVTCGPDGMMLFRAGHEPLGLPAAPTRRVYDVTGAGDTVAAVLTLGLAARWTVEYAARVANVAAGLVVGMVGTAVIEAEQLRAALEAGTPDFGPVPG